MKKYNAILILLLTVFTSCDNPTTTKNTTNESSSINFESGLIMKEASSDPLGNELNYPTGDPAISSQINVWEPGFKSPWHYHPYTGVAYVVKGELTVNYDTDTSLDDIDSEKTIVSSETYKAGDKAFLGVANTWHLSENNGSEDLIFIVSWLGEKDKPLAVLSK